MNLAQLCMEGSTLHFFKSLDENDGLTWDQLKVELLEKYGGIDEGDIFEQLAGLQQTATVDDISRSSSV